MGWLVRSWHLITGAAVLSLLVISPEARAAVLTLFRGVTKLVSGTVRLVTGGKA